MLGVQVVAEARGLLEPERAAGGARRYSQRDVVRLARIGELLAVGLNLAGIGMVLDLEQQNAELRAEKEEQRWPATAPTRRRSRMPAPTSTTQDSPPRRR